MVGVVLVPTFEGQSPLMRSLRQVLEADGCRVEQTPDLNEAGARPFGSRWTHVIGAARHLVGNMAGPPVLVGYSLGALAAARVAVASPARIGRLVLIAPVLEVTGRTEQARRRRPHVVARIAPLEAEAVQGFLEGAALQSRLGACPPAVISGLRDDTAPRWDGPGTVTNVDDDHFFGGSIQRISSIILTPSS
ncbi:MAG TPA: alpha/beta fold hydrolase [Candidatus Thermoplasmatota archaeon]|nr:alpha/beta fold hydrolase [Candidatus Thermoplasmatota archaeon]